MTTRKTKQTLQRQLEIWTMEEDLGFPKSSSLHVSDFETTDHYRAITQKIQNINDRRAFRLKTVVKVVLAIIWCVFWATNFYYATAWGGWTETHQLNGLAPAMAGGGLVFCVITGIILVVSLATE